jgi:hypothetical protein
MTKKDYDLRKEKRKIIKYRWGILWSVIFLTLGLLGLIGFNALLLYSTTNAILRFLAEALALYAIFINCFLIFFVSFIGLFLGVEISEYRSFKKKIEVHQQQIRSRLVARLELEKILEKVVLRFLTDNEGKAFNSVSLINRIMSDTKNTIRLGTITRNSSGRTLENKFLRLLFLRLSV